MDIFAFADSAPQGYVGNLSGRKSPLAELLKQDLMLSANCVRIGWDGKAEEGIFLEEDHPSCPGNVAIIFGESGRYLGSNRNLNLGCVYHVEGAKLRMRRASLDYIPIPDKRPVPVLGRLSRFDKPSYLLVHVDCTTPLGITPKYPLWAGIPPTHHEVASGGTEAVLKLELGNNVPARIFYADGRVAELSNKEGALLVNFFRDPEDILNARIDVVEQRLADTIRIRDEYKRKGAVDAGFHNLANMLILAKSSDVLRRKIVNEAEKLSARFEAGESVKLRFSSILTGLGDKTIYGWLADVIQSGPTIVSFSASLVNPKRFDGELHGLMSDAQAYPSEHAWDSIRKRLVKAAEDGQLRPGVKKRFLLQCLPEFAYMATEVGQLHAYGEEGGKVHSTSPLRQGRDKEDRRTIEARRKARRDARLAAQPKRGASSGSGQKQGSKGKGGKKN